jgi:hypothetical protein
MVFGGFFDRDADGLRLHDWDEYEGRLVAERQANAERMRQKRATAKRFAERAEDDAERAPHVQDTFGERAGLDKSREEEKREEKKRLEQRSALDTLSSESVNASASVRRAPSIPKYDLLFLRFWAAYPKKKNKAAAYDEWQKIGVDEPLVRRMLKAIEWQAEEWLDRDETDRFIPDAKSWLRDRRWMDDEEDDDQRTYVADEAWGSEDINDVPF